MTTADRYPNSQDLSNLRRDFALADKRAAFHAEAKARIARGQAWNKSTPKRAYASELANGIGHTLVSPYLASPAKMTALRLGSGVVLFGRDHI